MAASESGCRWKETQLERGEGFFLFTQLTRRWPLGVLHDLVWSQENRDGDEVKIAVSDHGCRGARESFQALFILHSLEPASRCEIWEFGCV
jgi:hypothetical protein